ncbi:MAG: nuclease [Nitrospirae bacterium RIFCSPLOW2_12_42_9]|nr:MAG: nuclease [Nitrospirae bacterium RIFCSPLOW2_12_42_9]HBI22811.1 nuclease [Nitrospiraceae bacterium]
MKRFIDQELKRWKESSRRKPLILRGARQVGKTYSVREFGKDCFDNIALVDLERNRGWHRIFDGDLNARRICADLEILLNQKILFGKTLLFIDEIQACPRAITALRYFYEELPDLHVVAAGSLLELAMKDISFPVGRVQFSNLYPLCFAEYLQATGKDEAAAIILGHPVKVSETAHAFLIEELRRYFFIGGMPESVRAFAETGSMRDAFEVQAEICETYRLDFAKYSPRADKHCLNAVLTTITQNVGQQIKYSRLGDGYSNPTLKRAFELLCLANIIRKIPSVDLSGLPLGATASEKIFKALLVDIGLMRHLTGMPVDVEYGKADLLSIYSGAMAEQFVGQEMVLSQKGDIYYWSRHAKSSSAEVDYVVVIDGKIYPIEVKSGAAGRLKSLHLFLETYKNSPKGIVFSIRPYAELPEKNIMFVPLYFALSATGGGRYNFITH